MSTEWHVCAFSGPRAERAILDIIKQEREAVTNTDKVGEHSQAFGTAPAKSHVQLGFGILHTDCDYHNGWGKQALLSPRNMDVLVVVVQLLQHLTSNCDCSGQLPWFCLVCRLLEIITCPWGRSPGQAVEPIQHSLVRWSCEMAQSHLQQVGTNMLLLLKQAQIPSRDALWECQALFGMSPSVHLSADLALTELPQYRINCVVLCPLESQHLHL